MAVSGFKRAFTFQGFTSVVASLLVASYLVTAMISPCRAAMQTQSKPSGTASASCCCQVHRVVPFKDSPTPIRMPNCPHCGTVDCILASPFGLTSQFDLLINLVSPDSVSHDAQLPIGRTMKSRRDDAAFVSNRVIIACVRLL